MSDIVERLRKKAIMCDYCRGDTELLNEAADEIQRLRKEMPIVESVQIDRLRSEVERLTAEFEAEHKKHEWVSTKEGLPEEEDYVIACDTDGFVYPQARWTWDVFRETRIWEWAYEAGTDYWVDIDNPVTHWMTLPDPPKGAEE